MLSFAVLPVHCGFTVAPSFRAMAPPRAVIHSAMNLNQASLASVFHKVDKDHNVRRTANFGLAFPSCADGD
jgi:hypothetical protein